MSHIYFPKVPVYVSIFRGSCGVWSAEGCQPGTCAPLEVGQNVLMGGLGQGDGQQVFQVKEMHSAASNLGLTVGGKGNEQT